jgi:hypothetical protein
MQLTGMTLCRNEERFIGYTGRVALQWCDHWIVLLHACHDKSQRIVERIWDEFPNRVTILIASTSDRWDEMTHRQWMLEQARTLGSTHIALIDADEMLTGSGLPYIRQATEQLAPGQFLRVPMRNLCDSMQTYRNEKSVWGQATTVVTFANRSDLHWSPRDGYHYHHRHPHNSVEGNHITSAEVLHLQMVSRFHLTAKHVWYQMMERDRYPDLPVAEIATKYSQAPDRNGIELASCPEEWFAPYKVFEEYLLPLGDSGKSNWHIDECRRLMKKHNKAYFDGLNFFEIPKEILFPN